MPELLLDAAGRRRSPATLPAFHAGRPPRNEGMRDPADPPTIEEIIAVIRRAGNGVHGRRLRGLIVVLWRPGRRREVGMDDWAWEQLAPWLQARVELPVGPLFCVVNGPTRGRPWSAAAARSELRHIARQAGVRRRFAPHQLRHAHAVNMAREGVPLIVIQRQLGHTNLGITSIYLQGGRVGSDAERAMDGDHRGAAGVDRVDDLGVVDGGGEAGFRCRSSSISASSGRAKGCFRSAPVPDAGVSFSAPGGRPRRRRSRAAVQEKASSFARVMPLRFGT